MKRNSVLLLAVGLVVAVVGGSSAEPPPVEQIYFDATVTKQEKVVSKTAALVKVGALAKLSFAGQGEETRRFGLTYKVDESPGSAFTAQVTTLVDGKEVATGTVSFGRNEAAGVTLERDGYVWQVNAELMTPELLKRRTRKKP
jgi:hypothetical protein